MLTVLSSCLVDSRTSDLDVFPPELREKIMDSCDMKTMTALSGTSKFWDRKRNECIYYRVIRLLEHFQLDPPSFLDLLTRTKSVISGSGGLLVFCPTLFVPGDLDIYCDDGKLEEILEFFRTFTEYREPEERPVADELARDVDYANWLASESHLSKVLKLSCSPSDGSANMEPKLVNIIAVRRIQTISAISYFHSTPVMNIITGTGAICVYPELTFRMRGVINTQSQSLSGSEKFKNCLDKYRERGFDLAISVGKWSGMRRNFAMAKPLGDMPVCAIPFPNASVEAGATRAQNRAALDGMLWELIWGLSEWALDGE